ncbi:MAG TPA: ABC transporter ATP-binding protein [Dehalococcoidia bacterium]|jgi:putative ABC transport system ATP-binding protein|nr:ABC transporter ATP-binding protein [Dehalococcoidia bacterium]
MYQVQELTKIYDMGKVKVKALEGVSFTVPDGDMLAIMGRSGSGKSTLLRQMGLLDQPTSGRILLDGREVSRLPERERAKLRLRHLGYVFQEYALLGELTAHQNVYLPGMMLGEADNYRERARELLELVGLGERINHYPKELSGGEQQRVAIARALINRPRVLLADEPCANLDTISSAMVMETLVRLNRELGVTVIFVSHDPDDRKYAQSVLVLSDGRIAQRSGQVK